MLNSFSNWLCNLMVWGAVITFALLLYEAFASKGFLANQVDQVGALIAVGVVAVVSLFWPRY
jgi:hypothetical protein